jgi:hypothetical protein
MSGLITYPIALDFPNPYPVYFRSFVAQLTRQRSDSPVVPKVYPKDQHHREAERVRAEAGFAGDRPVLACTVSTRQGTGALSPRLFVAIIEAAREHADFGVALCGDTSERQRLTAIASTLSFDAKVLAGQLSVLGFAAFTGSCAALLSPDSGPRHLGNAMGTPVFFTRNLSQLAVETGKYCGSETDVVPAGFELMEPDAVREVEKAVDVKNAGRLIADAIRRWSVRA